jgi:hypothetical protein
MLFDQEPVCIHAELAVILIAALKCSSKRFPEVQTEHFHKAFGIDLMLRVAHTDGKAAGGSQGNKVQNILNRQQFDRNFPHDLPSTLYKLKSIVYNRREYSLSYRLRMKNIISFSGIFSIVSLDDSYNFSFF